MWTRSLVVNTKFVDIHFVDSKFMDKKFVDKILMDMKAWIISRISNRTLYVFRQKLLQIWNVALKMIKDEYLDL